MRIAILGPGGVGGFLAAMLVRAGESVTVIGREAEVELIERERIFLESVRFGELRAHPPATARIGAPTDILLVSTKAMTLPEALERVEVQPGLVVPFLNGLEHMVTLRSRFGGPHVAAGAIRMEADRPAPGRVVHRSPSARIELASDHRSAEGSLGQLARILDSAQIPTVVGTSEAQVLWSKLVRLGPLATTTAVTGRPIGFIRSDPPWRGVLLSTIAEVVAVAHAEGARIDLAAPLAELDAAHPTLGSPNAPVATR